MTPEQRETWKEHQERLYAMAVDDGDTWDLSENDQAACNAGGDAIMALLDRAALAPAPTCGTWQPIETAPKDGTPILVADANSVEMGVWQEETEDDTECGVVTIPGFDAGWWGSEWQPGANQPTHWMPLPAAPTEPTR